MFGIFCNKENIIEKMRSIKYALDLPTERTSVNSVILEAHRMFYNCVTFLKTCHIKLYTWSVLWKFVAKKNPTFLCDLPKNHVTYFLYVDVEVISQTNQMFFFLIQWPLLKKVVSVLNLEGHLLTAREFRLFYPTGFYH